MHGLESLDRERLLSLDSPISIRTGGGNLPHFYRWRSHWPVKDFAEQPGDCNGVLELTRLREMIFAVIEVISGIPAQIS